MSGRHKSWVTADTINAHLDRYCIKEALVTDLHARVVHPREDGNSRMMAAIKDNDRLHPVWVIEPPKQPGQGAVEELVGAILEAGVKAVRFPMSHIPPMEWLWKDLCSKLAEHHVPCFLDFGKDSTWGDLKDTDIDGIRDIARAHPELPLVISHVMGGLGVHPGMLYLLRRVDNLYLDILGILEYWREFAADCGPQRVLFASGAPFTDTGILISNIQYMVGFTDEERKLMYGNNLRRLLAGVR
ncbi:amidohydrolase family protein, partial [Planctomycetota bacterium]